MGADLPYVFLNIRVAILGSDTSDGDRHVPRRTGGFSSRGHLRGWKGGTPPPHAGKSPTFCCSVVHVLWVRISTGAQVQWCSVNLLPWVSAKAARGLRIHAGTTLAGFFYVFQSVRNTFNAFKKYFNKSVWLVVFFEERVLWAFSYVILVCFCGAVPSSNVGKGWAVAE